MGTSAKKVVQKGKKKSSPSSKSTVSPVAPALTAAEQDALAEKATRTQRKDNQAKSTRSNWEPKKKEFEAWARVRYKDQDRPELVDGTKLHSFLALEQVGRPTKRPRKTGATTEDQSIGYSSIEAYASAIITLWQEQVDSGTNISPHPRTSAVKGLLHNVQVATAARDAAAFTDKRGAADDGYDHDFYCNLCRYFLQDGSHVSTRSLLAQILGHQCLLRGINLRKFCLSDLELGEMPNGMSPARILIVRANESKKNRTGRTEYSGALRHADSLLDSHFALGLYLFQRFHLLSEPFPDLSTNSEWYQVRLLRSQVDNDLLNPISYDSHKDPITKAFKALGLTGCKKVTHAARGSGAREAELLEVSTTDISRLGGWKASQDAMEQSYLTHLPIRALRAMSGFHPSGGTYYLPRDTLEPPPALQTQIFPQIEGWQLRMDKGEISTTGGADKFLALLRHLRRVILQDLPNLVKINPAHPVLQSPIFRSAAFLAWSKQQSDYLDQHTPPLELSLRTVVPTITDKLERISQQQSMIQKQLTSLQESRETSEELSRRRDEAIMYEVQRHSEAMYKLQMAPTATFPPLSSSDPASPPADRVVLTPAAAADGSSRLQLLAPPGLPLSLTSSSTVPFGSLFSSSASSIGASALTAAELERTSGAHDAQAAAQYALSGAVKTVGQAWQEWNAGFAGGPSLKSLEKEFGTSWCGGPSSAKRRAFLRRMVIINAINAHQDGTVDDAISNLQRRMGTHSLDWLRKQLGHKPSSSLPTASGRPLQTPASAFLLCDSD